MRISQEILDKKIADYRISWESDKLLTLENFLEPDDAAIVSDFLEQLPDDAWAVSVHPHHPTIYTFSNTQENQPTIEAAIKSASAEYARGGFSYYFRRHEPAANDHFDFQQLVMSDPCLAILKNVTGHDLTTSISVFCSCYTASCFLSTHTDTGRGKIAFVYNATRTWDPGDGGQFQLLSQDWSKVTKTVQPMHNSLTFFDVEGEGVPHRVLPVSPQATARRLAISGWLI